MPVKQCILDGSKIRSLDDLYDQISNQISLPGHFSRNLDALWDVLSADIEGPFEIIWKQSDISKNLLGINYDRMLGLFQELEKERSDFVFKIEL